MLAMKKMKPRECEDVEKRARRWRGVMGNEIRSCGEQTVRASPMPYLLTFQGTANDS